MLIKSNANILGIKINNEEFKISQFADDTTLILDGSQGSLQAALSPLEVYGSYSGLKMNKDKRKVIWIGRMRYSKDKLKISINLDWGDTQFTLLGLKFSVNLSHMPEINYQAALEKMKIVIKNWKNRNTSWKNKLDQNKYNL